MSESVFALLALTLDSVTPTALWSEVQNKLHVISLSSIASSTCWAINRDREVSMKNPSQLKRNKFQLDR